MKTFAAYSGFAFAVLGSTMLCAGPAHAHFILQAPAASLEQDAYGDPQKDPPCGGAGTDTGMVTAFQAGDTVTITITETIFHPGHFRVALAIDDPNELPLDPDVMPGESACGTVEIMDPPVFPVLADGMLLHTEPFADSQSFDVQLPDDISCDACTLQVIMFMQQHGAPCFYHHCATISIQSGATEGTTSVTGGESGSSGADGSSEGGSATASAGESEASSAGDGASEDSTTAATTGGVTDGASMGDSGGCGCTTASPPRVAAALAVLGMLGLRRRRR